MSFSEHASTFDGKPVVTYAPGTEPENVGAIALRVGSGGWDDDDVVSDLVGQLAAEPWAGKVTAVVLGWWNEHEHDDDSERITQALVAAHKSLTSLRALFFADVTFEENEISWIEHTDVSPILEAYPGLKVLQLRGGGTRFGHGGHPGLETLVVQSGGMDPNGVRDIGASSWPSLTHLELWLGMDDYGGGATSEHWAGILAGQGLPKLTFLGLMNSDNQDTVAKDVATAPIIERLETLDLSKGTLGDNGATWILSSALLRRVKRINVRHNFVSDAMTPTLAALPNVVGAEEKADDYDEDEDWRYTECGE